MNPIRSYHPEWDDAHRQIRSFNLFLLYTAHSSHLDLKQKCLLYISFFGHTYELKLDNHIEWDDAHRQIRSLYLFLLYNAHSSHLELETEVLITH